MPARAALAARIPFATAKREEQPTRFIPYARHVTSEIVSLDSGDLMLMLEVDGRPFETSEVRDLNDWHTRLNAVWRNIHDERLSIWTHVLRTRVADYPGGTFRSRFAASLDRQYFARMQAERLFRNRFFLTVVVRPHTHAADRVWSFLQRREDKRQTARQDMLELLEDKVSDLEKLLARIRPRRLGLYERHGLMFSEPMEVMNEVLTGRFRRCPLVRGHLGSALYAARAIIGTETLEIRDADKSAFAGIFGIREYPATTTPRQFEALLSTDFSLAITQSFTFLSRASATERFRLRLAQMENAGDKALSQMDDLVDAADDLQSNRFVLGDHHFTLAVFAETLSDLRDNMSVARSALADSGMVAARESAALEAAYWSQLVGNFAWRARPAPITSRNFAAFSPFHTFPAGKARDNHWGPAVALLRTTARSPYYFNFHQGDVGHSLIVGPSGSGKTVLVNFLMAQLEKFNARHIFIDKDHGAEIFVRASGGTYLSLRNGEPTGFAPLKALSNTAQHRAFLGQFIRQLVQRDNRPLTVQESALIDDGVEAIMRLPRAERSLSALRTMLGVSDAEGAGARLAEWTAEGALGWVFDNEEDSMALESRFCGFDMTDFLDNAKIRTPVMLYLFQRIDALLNGERMVIAIDEFWKALADPVFTSFAQDGLKTYRKRNAILVFATQSPADALRSEISHSILEQVATKIFLPNPSGQRRDYVDGFALTEAEFRLIQEELAPESHSMLVRQGHDSVVVTLSLEGLHDALAVLSGRASTTAVARSVIAEFGHDPDAWLPAFYEQLKALERKVGR